jgi:hypothetical protein
MKKNFTKWKQLSKASWFRWSSLVVVALFVYWAGAGFPGPSGPSYDEYGYDDYAYGESESFAVSEMAFDSKSVRSFAPTSAAILPPFPEPGNSGDLTQYDEVGARIIKTGNVSMDVKDTNQTLTSISELASGFGGFVQNSNTWLNYNDTLAGSITLRVESQHFESAMEAIKKMATVVRSESVSGQDVTEEFIDIQARLGTLTAEEEQYLEVLKKAETVEEILQVNDYLAGVRKEIETTKGRMQYLENKTAFSTISVDVSEEASVVAPTRDWQPLVVAKEAINDLVLAAQEVVNGLIWLAIFGVPVVLGLWLVWKLFTWIRKTMK